MKRSCAPIALACLILASTALASHPGDARAQMRDDVDRNAVGDIFFRDGSSLAYWSMSAGPQVLTYSYAGDGGPGYTVVAVNDFDGDHSADVLWTNGSHLQLWVNNGAGSYTSVPVGNYGGGWAPYAAEDINGDGKSDLFFRSSTHLAFWLMDGAAVLSSTYAGDGGAGWRPAVIGNLNGDGKAEVLWTNGTQLKVWNVKDPSNHGDDYQSNTVEFYAWLMDETYGGGWTPFAVGDVNGDHLTDILFRRGTHVAYWLLKAVDGPLFPYHEYEGHYAGNGGDGFRVLAVSNYNNDERTADLLWTNGSEIKIWVNGCSPWDYGCSPSGDADAYEAWPIIGSYGGGWEPLSALSSPD